MSYGINLGAINRHAEEQEKERAAMNYANLRNEALTPKGEEGQMSIALAIGEMSRTISYNEALLATLQQRLSPIMRGVDAVGGATKRIEPEGQIAPLVADVRSMVQRLEAQSQIMKWVIEGLS